VVDLDALAGAADAALGEEVVCFECVLHARAFVVGGQRRSIGVVRAWGQCWGRGWVLRRGLKRGGERAKGQMAKGQMGRGSVATLRDATAHGGSGRRAVSLGGSFCSAR